MKKVLVVGSGGREHALVWALSRSPQVSEIYAAPGNGGTSGQATNVPIEADDVPGLVHWATRHQIDLTLIGPEVPLALGLADALIAKGLRVFGPVQAAAQIEASKAFSKDFMLANGIPTATSHTFGDYAEAQAYLDAHSAPIVVKANGLAAGKGAIVCQTMEQARTALREIMVDRVFGSAGDLVVIEEFLTGTEVSVLAFCDGEHVAPMVLAQDHKAAYDGDQGPNTGGMGTYAPAALLDDNLQKRVLAQVLQPAMDGFKRRGTPYVGVLYAGLMVSGNDFRVLEFNCRFGDPEAQVILPLLRTDLVEVCEACIDGRLDEIQLEWADMTCTCVVLASGGYPSSYPKGFPIQGLERAANRENSFVFHAGTRQEGDQIVTAGGRVLGVTAWAPELAQSIAAAYATVELIHWQDMTYRNDIGAKGLATRRDQV